MDGRDDRRSKWPKLIRILYRWCQRFCVWSEIPLVFDSFVVREEIGGRHPEGHSVITYGGCEACETNRRKWLASQGPRHFLVLARAEPENQLVEAVRAVRAMLTQSRLSVVTTSRYQGKYWHSLVREVGRTDTAELIDGIWDKEQLCSMYRDVAAVIHGHTVGGTNPSLVLALCHGTPVLAHDNPYNREVAGSLARYWKNEAELTKLLDEFDPTKWPYDQAAVDDFNRRYNWDDVVEKYRQLLGL
jgi:glycosyltransferase involved in cell wall biosynthesis